MEEIHCTPSGKQLKEAIATDLYHRYASLNQQQMLCAAAFLDPRFKDLDPFVPETDRKDVREAVKLEMLKLPVAGEQTDETQSEAETNAHSSESEQDPLPTKKTKPGKVSHFFSNLTGTIVKRKHVSRYNAVKSELDRYDREPLLDLDEDPLEW